MLVLRLGTADHQLWALSLYSTRPNSFHGEDVDAVQALVAHTATTVGTALEVEGMRATHEGKTVVGRAQGLVMERYGVDPGVS